MTYTRILACSLALAAMSAAQPLRLSSPDEKLSVTLEPRADAFEYRADYSGKPLLLPARLGTTLYSGIFEVVRQSTRSHASEWRTVYGERSIIPDRYRELTVELRDKVAPHRALHLILRAYNEGLAFRYHIPGTGRFLYAQEYSEFRFPPEAFAYEEHGTEGGAKRVPVGAIQRDCERPLTVDYGNGLYATLLEAASIDYPRMLISPARGKSGVLFSDLSGPVEATAPFNTPWRVLIVGQRPGDLLERNYLVANLNPPNAIADTSWIKPGKVIREITLSTPGGKACVDFAVKHGLQYIEYDAGWYGHEYFEASDARGVSLDPDRVGKIPNHPGLDLQEVIRYASERGIGVFLYVNRRALERQLDVVFPLYRKWGVKGVKFGFVNVGPQAWTAWLNHAIRKAAENHLMVDIHDNYRPSGWERTWPNLLTQEGVRGNENMPTATQNANLPFTRYVAGPADATICYYDTRYKTTRAHQLALAVVFYSPLQFLYWYDKPSAHGGEPETEFFKNVPTVWDDTRVVDGRIGEFAAIARRSGREWFTGAIAGDAPRDFDLPLRFLAPGVKYSATIYSNGAGKNDVTIERRSVTSGTVLRLSLPAAGGHAVRLVPE